MKKTKNYFFSLDIASSCLFLCSLFFLIFIPVTEKDTIWHSYRILFLPMSADESAILKAAEESGIKNIISSLTIKQRFAKLDENNYTGFPFTDKERYAAWFINDQENIRYMYIHISENIPPQFFKYLKNNTEAFYIERKAGFSLFQFISAAAFFLIAFYFTSRKDFYLFASLPFIVYAGIQSGILALSASILMMFTLAFWTEAVGSYLKFTKEQIISRIKKNPLLVFLPFISFVVAKFNSNISLLVFILAVIAAASFTYISERIRFFIHKNSETKKLHKTITPYIMNPKSIAKFWESKKLFTVSGAAAFFIIFSSLILHMGFNKTLQAYKNILYLPVPVNGVEITGFSKQAFDKLKEIRTGEDLPDLGNLISDLWNSNIKPYVKSNENTENYNEIKYSDFSVDSNGMITENAGTAFSFDDEFIKTALAFRESPSIEDLLYSEGRFITAAYTGRKFPLNSFNTAALLVAVLSSFMPVTIILLRVLNK
ncbi:hypothetical protein [Treponema pedis]|uniref:Uncharacterized protein n=1 Tax=Treponema pedis str. T A4 TaxID=1291379 RepID=S5ZQH7_9SPIR|nr:hypothetical protein [Treponema pedis]AGT44917.1 hypothetical protein TPE_2443 [Treponema pedis str. T A4]QSI05545.1 hypothetical protein DYQ05_11805 [Treponema pedis]